MATWEAIQRKLDSLNDAEFLDAAKRIGGFEGETVSQKTRTDFKNQLYPKCMKDAAIRNITSYRLGLPTDEEVIVSNARSAATSSKLSATTAVVATIIALLALILNYCADRSDPTPHNVDQSSKNMIDKQGAIDIARQAVSENDTWVSSATFEANRFEDGWSVLAQRLPVVPGGHRLIIIDDNGNVTDYSRGR